MPLNVSSLHLFWQWITLIFKQTFQLPTKAVTNIQAFKVQMDSGEIGKASEKRFVIHIVYHDGRLYAGHVSRNKSVETDSRRDFASLARDYLSVPELLHLRRDIGCATRVVVRIITIKIIIIVMIIIMITIVITYIQVRQVINKRRRRLQRSGLSDNALIIWRLELATRSEYQYQYNCYASLGIANELVSRIGWRVYPRPSIRRFGHRSSLRLLPRKSRARFNWDRLFERSSGRGRIFFLVTGL